MHPRFDQYDAIFGDDPGSYLEFLDALEATLTKSGRTCSSRCCPRLDCDLSPPPLKPAMTLLGAEPINALLHEWRPSMSALDVEPLASALDQVLKVVQEKRASLA